MLHVCGISVSAMVVGDALDVMPIGPGALPQPMRRTAPDVAPTDVLELELDPAGLRDLLAGVPGAVAVKGPPAGVSILVGGSALLARFRLTFRIDPVGPPRRAVRDAGETASVA